MERTVQDLFGYKRPRGIAGKKSVKSHAVGIEVELEYIKHPVLVDHWKQVEDHSLKVRGKEYTLAVWHNNAQYYLEYLFNNVYSKKSTSRCSTHVHVDITDYTANQIKSIILHYIVFEKLLYAFSGKRWNNIFCVPVQTYIVGSYIDNLSLSQLKRYFPKYAGIHLFADDKLGTLEFRQMVGNTNPAYIQTWINILVTMVKKAVETDYEDLKQQLFDMRAVSSYWNFFDETFKEYNVALNGPTFKEDVEQGITIAKLLFTNNQHLSETAILRFLKPKKVIKAKERIFNLDEILFQDLPPQRDPVIPDEVDENPPELGGGNF